MSIDVTVESIRAFILIAIFGYLLYNGRKRGVYNHKGWNSLVAGFALIFVGSIIDVTDNFPELNKYIFIGDTPVQAILEKLVFSLGGFMLLYYGFREWLPYVARFQDIEVEKRYRSIIEKSTDIVYTADIEGYFTYVNPVAAKLTGYSEEKLMTMRFTDLVDHDYRDYVNAHYYEQFKEKIPETICTFPIHTKENDRRWVEQVVTLQLKDNQISGFQSIVRDITERYLTEEALIESEEKYRTLTSNLHVGIFRTTPGQEGDFLEINPGFLSIFGFASKSELMDNRVSDIYFEPNDRKEFDKAMRLKGKVTDREIKYRRKDGSTFVGSLSAIAVKDEKDDVLYYDGFVEDITERKEAERALILAKLEAEASSASKSEFLANMSHELRTPLNSVIGFSNILLKNQAGTFSESDLNFLHRISENGKHLLGNINDILDLSKVEAGKMEVQLSKVNLQELIIQTLSKFEAQISGKPIELTNEGPEDVLWLNTDEAKLKQIIINLISNAIKFTESGQISIIVIPYEHSNSPQFIHVKDTGIGIHKEQIDTIFDSFKQADTSSTRKFGGTGLGLTLCKQFSNLLGLSLSVTSNVGKGSQFTIEIPEQKIDSDIYPDISLSQKLSSAEHVDMTGKKILVVDDDKDSAFLITKIINEYGAETIEAYNGADAIKLAEEEQPDLISLDLELPDIPGWEILKQLKNNPVTSSIPVIIVSIVAKEKKGSILGAMDYIQKPVEKSELYAAINRNLDRPPTSVLIVDDDLAARKQITYSLKPFGVNLIEAMDGIHAKEYIDQGGSPDVIILDLALPRMNGLSFFKHVRQIGKLKQVPVIIVTSKDLDPDEKKYFENEARAVVQKGPELITELRHLFKPLIELGGVK